MKKEKVNLNCYHFEIKGNTLIIYGERGKGQSKYEIHAKFDSLSFFKILAIGCIKRIKEEYLSVLKMYNEIKSF